MALRTAREVISVRDVRRTRTRRQELRARHAHQDSLPAVTKRRANHVNRAKQAPTVGATAVQLVCTPIKHTPASAGGAPPASSLPLREHAVRHAAAAELVLTAVATIAPVAPRQLAMGLRVSHV